LEHWKQLSVEKQEAIQTYLSQGKSLRFVCRAIGVAPHTVRKYAPKGHKFKHNYTQVDKIQLEELFRQGKTRDEIAASANCSIASVARYVPESIPARPKRKYKATRKGTAFPVHPEVEEAKDSLLMSFCLKPFDPSAFAAARARLAYLLEKHQPAETRPVDQLDSSNSRVQKILLNEINS